MTPESGRSAAYTIGWRLFLALIVATPLVIGGLPQQFGPLSAFRAFDIFGLPKAVAVLVLAGLSLSALCVNMIRGGSTLRWHPVMWVATAFVGWAAVSAVLSANPAVSVWGSYHMSEGLVAQVGYVLVAFLALQYVRSTRALRTVAVAAVVSGAIVAVYALLQFAGIDPFGWVNDTGRVFSTMGNADSLGTYLVFPLAFAVGLALSARTTRAKAAWWGAAVLLGAAMLASATRGAWIAALAMAVCIGLLGRGDALRVSRRRLAVLVTGAVAALGAVSVAIVMVRPRLAASATTLSALLTSLSNGRTVIWATGLRAWLANPIAGWGPDGFGRAFQSAVGADWYAIVAGLQGAENAHSIVVQTLVTLGIPGLALLMWALGQTAAVTVAAVRGVRGPDRMLFIASWAAFIGMIVALLFGLTTPGVTVWLWLAAGLLLAPVSRAVAAPRRPALAGAAALGVVLAVWAGSWLVADVVVGHAMQLNPGSDQVAELRSATAIDPLTPNYRWLVADALVSQAVAMQKAGQGATAVDPVILDAISAYETALAANPGDALVRAGFSNVLVSYAAQHPASTAATRALEVALEAERYAPRNPAVLAALARAYEISGRHAEAVAAARLARQVAPEYAASTLGTLGADAATSP